MWKEAFELRTGNQYAAKRLARLVINQQRLHKRDTIADFWSRRLHDMQLRDDPVESGYGQSPPPSQQEYGGASPQKQVTFEYCALITVVVRVRNMELLLEVLTHLSRVHTGKLHRPPKDRNLAMPKISM